LVEPNKNIETGVHQSAGQKTSGLIPESGNPVSERAWLLDIQRSANQVAAAGDRESLVGGMLDLMRTISQAETALFLVQDAETKGYIVSAVRGDGGGQHLLGLRLPEGSVNTEKKIVHGEQPCVAGDLYEDPYWMRLVMPQEAMRTRNIICLPLCYQDQLLGQVNLLNFQKGDLDVLSLLADRLSQELANREQLISSQQATQRLYALINAIGQISGILDQKHLLNIVSEQASHLVDAERSSVFIVDPETQQMSYQIAYQLPSHEPDSFSKLSSAISQPANPLTDTGLTSKPPAHKRDEFNFFTSSAITVPLLSGSSDIEDRRTVGGLMVLNKRNGTFQAQDSFLLEILANQTSTFLQVANLYENAGELFMQAIQALVAVIDAKDPNTQGHSQRVSDYSVLIAERLGLSPTKINDIRIGSMLHDVGKIGIPDAVLNKKGLLLPEEREIINRHPAIGYKIISQVKMLGAVLPAIVEHHERLDGSGYPACRHGEEISIMGRIVMVADVFDAMTSDRPYRASLSTEEAISILHNNAGKQFDTSCVRALEAIVAQRG
jgi:HD-GYP domain-containing protein (c-di-GMP phosphodiesterase class II)